MADAVTSQVLADGPRNHVVHLTNVSDGTGESAVVKVDVSALSEVRPGVPCGSLKLKRIAWKTEGMQVRLLWDATADVVFQVLPMDSQGDETFDPPLPDNAGAGRTGDVKLTTVNHSSGDSYDVTLYFIKGA